MISSIELNSHGKTARSTKIFSPETQNVKTKSQHKDSELNERVAPLLSPKTNCSGNDKHIDHTCVPKRKEFVIPRKKKQAKDLLQTQRSDSREGKDLLRRVQLSLRDPSCWPIFKFEKVEFVNNDKLTKKYGEKKQALRLEMRTNRDVEDKLAFMYTASRTEAKAICENGLSTGQSLLTSIGDPKLGVYLCRFADVIQKRPLTSDDSGYLIVFHVLKGKVRFIGGSNPELEPTPNHDCHVSKSLPTLSSTAPHSEVYESSQFYLYEIDEYGDEFHVKQPRQILPYAVLTFSVAVPENKIEVKKPAPRHAVSSSEEEKLLSSPRIEKRKKQIKPIAHHISWSGEITIKNKPLAQANFLSYSRRKHTLAIYLEQTINISQKIAHNKLKSLLKCPIFRNGKPISSGISKEINSDGKYVHYEVQPVKQVREKFGELVTYFVDHKLAGAIEYCEGAIQMYLIPTSQLTHDIGITDRKSPVALHALVHVKRFRHLPTAVNETAEERPKQSSDVDDSVVNEEVFQSQVRQVFRKKYKKTKKRHNNPKLPSLMSSEIELGQETNDSETSSSVATPGNHDTKLPLLPEGASHDKRVEYQNDVQHWIEQVYHSKSKPVRTKTAHDEQSSHFTRKNSRYTWTNPDLQSTSSSSAQQCYSKADDESKIASPPFVDVAGNDVNMEMSLDSIGENIPDKTNRKANYEINFSTVQKLIQDFQQHETDSKGTSTMLQRLHQDLSGTKVSLNKDPRSHRSASLDTCSSTISVNNKNSSHIPSMSPPPPPPPMFSLVTSGLMLPETTSSSALVATSSLDAATFMAGASSSTLGMSISGPCSSTAALPFPITYTPVSPPSVERHNMAIPGLELPGSLAFQMMKEDISFLNRNIVTTDSYLNNTRISNQSLTTWKESHPTTPLQSYSARNTCNTLPSSEANHVGDNTHCLLGKLQSSNLHSKHVAADDVQKCPARTNISESEYKSDLAKTNSTLAERKGSQVLKEIVNIIQNAVTARDDDDDCGDDALMNEHRALDRESIVRECKDFVTNHVDENMNTTGNTPGADSVAQAKAIALLQATDLDSNLPRQATSPYTSPDTPELKSGLDLLKNLMSREKKQCVSPRKVLESEATKLEENPRTRRQMTNSETFSKTVDVSNNLENKTTPRTQTPDRKRSIGNRTVTVKSTTPSNDRWDDITSDISDTELPEERITSDISDTELHSDDCMDNDESLVQDVRSRDDRSRSLLRANRISRHSSRASLASNRQSNTGPHGRYCSSDVRISPSNYDRGRESRQRALKNYRGSRDISPEHWDKEAKKRRVDTTEKLDDAMEIVMSGDESSRSTSSMSISPINSPVSFEYAVPTDSSASSKYRSVMTSPWKGGCLQVTIAQGHDGSTVEADYTARRRTIVPRSPTEVDITATPLRPSTPGTPETAVPGIDFLHENVGYWSSEFTTKGSKNRPDLDEFPDDSMGYPQKKDVGLEPAMPDVVQRAYGGADRGWSSSSSSPYDPLHDDTDDSEQAAKRRRVEKTTGEGYAPGDYSATGGSSGYETPCYYTYNHNREDDNLDSLYKTKIEKLREDIYKDCTEYDDYRDRYTDTTDKRETLKQRQLYYTTSTNMKQDIESPHSFDSLDSEDYTRDKYSGGTYGNDSGRRSTFSADETGKYTLKKRTVDDDGGGEQYYGSPGDAQDEQSGSHSDEYRSNLRSYRTGRQQYSSDGDARDSYARQYSDHTSSDDDKSTNYRPCKYQQDVLQPQQRNLTSDEDRFDDESLSTPEYYERDEHKYLDDIVANDLSRTQLALDRAVYDGIKTFPEQLLELSKYLYKFYKSTEEVVASGPVSSNSNDAIIPSAKRRDPRLDSGVRVPRYRDGGVSSDRHAQRKARDVTDSTGTTTDSSSQALKTTKSLRAYRKAAPKKQYFYVYDPNNDPECDSVKRYMEKTGAQYLDVNDVTKLIAMTGDLRVLIRRKNKQSLHRIINLDELKMMDCVKFALFNTVEDVSKKTRAYAAIFQYGGVVIPDDNLLRTIDPAYLEALLSFMAIQNSIHQKVFWVMNIRYLAYKKLGYQRPLTWRDTFVLDLLKKCRVEGFVNIINKDYVLENLSPVQRYLDTACKQQLEMLPTYRHFILLSDELDETRVEVSWFKKRGIGFMNVTEYLRVFAGKVSTRQLLSSSTYSHDETTQGRVQYDPVSPPADDDDSSSVYTTSSEVVLNSQLSEDQRKAIIKNNVPISRSLSCSAVTRSPSIKEQRLLILSSIKDVKANLLENLHGKMSALPGTKDVRKQGFRPQQGDLKAKQQANFALRRSTSQYDSRTANNASSSTDERSARHSPRDRCGHAEQKHDRTTEKQGTSTSKSTTGRLSNRVQRFGSANRDDRSRSPSNRHVVSGRAH